MHFAEHGKRLGWENLQVVVIGVVKSVHTCGRIFFFLFLFLFSFSFCSSCKLFFSLDSTTLTHSSSGFMRMIWAQLLFSIFDFLRERETHTQQVLDEWTYFRELVFFPFFIRRVQGTKRTNQEQRLYTQRSVKTRLSIVRVVWMCVNGMLVWTWATDYIIVVLGLFFLSPVHVWWKGEEN